MTFGELQHRFELIIHRGSILTPLRVLSEFNAAAGEDSEGITWAQRGAREHPGTTTTVLTSQAAQRYCVDPFGKLRQQVDRYEHEGEPGGPAGAGEREYQGRGEGRKRPRGG